jgi:hypothetical protein
MKQQIIEILKLLYGFRRDPYLKFSGLLVTSGCLLLSKGIIEKIIDLFAEYKNLNQGKQNLTETIATSAGIFLIVIGLSIFYYKFLHKKALSKEFTKDSETIRYIFFEITSLRNLDLFMDRALYPYLVQYVLEEFNIFENYLHSSFYHIYDKKLSELVERFYKSWRDVCAHWEAFTPTNVPNILRPNTYMDIARTDDVREAIEKVPKAAQEMHANQMKLLKYIRDNYRNIEI